MNFGITNILNASSLLGILITLISRVMAKHLPIHFPDKTLTLDDKFVNDIKTLIKLRLIGNTAANSNFATDKLLTKKRLSTSKLDVASKIPLNVPTPVLVENWPVNDYSFGQLTSVSIDPQGNPVIFHRADRYWNTDSFNGSNIYNFIEYGPILDKTIYILDPKTGSIKSGWGEGLFYMPHGLTIDIHGNYWITDVAMHQALKFKPFETQPILTIGKRFQPGSSVKHLCKPTSVAISSTGEFFIADGYCNQRILKFNAAGRLLRVIPQPPEFLSLQVPHAITLLEHLDLLCIADRENMRVVCPNAGLKSSKEEGQPAATIQEPDLGRVFGVAAYGDIVYTVNGPTSLLPVRGFTIDPNSEKIIGRWGEFKNPHSIATYENGSVLYVAEIGTNYQTNRIWKYVVV